MRDGVCIDVGAVPFFDQGRMERQPVKGRKPSPRNALRRSFPFEDGEEGGNAAPLGALHDDYR